MLTKHLQEKEEVLAKMRSFNFPPRDLLTRYFELERLIATEQEAENITTYNTKQPIVSKQTNQHHKKTPQQ